MDNSQDSGNLENDLRDATNRAVRAEQQVDELVVRLIDLERLMRLLIVGDLPASARARASLIRECVQDALREYDPHDIRF